MMMDFSSYNEISAQNIMLFPWERHDVQAIMFMTSRPPMVGVNHDCCFWGFHVWSIIFCIPTFASLNKPQRSFVSNTASHGVGT